MPFKRPGFLRLGIAGPWHLLCLWILLIQGLPALLGREWDRPGAVRAYEQAGKLNASLHAERVASRTPQRYLEVIQKYRQVLLKDPHFGGCDDSLYFMGKLYQEMGERFRQPRYYQLAVDTYLRLVGQYPRTTYGADALMAAGDLLVTQLRKPEAAETQFQKVISTYSSSAQAKSARQALDSLEKNKAASRDSKSPAANEPPVHLSGPNRQNNDSAHAGSGKNKEHQDPATVNSNKDRPPAGSLELTRGPQLKPTPAPGGKATSPSPASAASPGTLMAAPKRLDPPKPARPTSAGVRTLTRTLGLKTGKIVIDPGHGGHDTGTIGKQGLREKDLALDLALRLRAIIQGRLDAEVILTRETDVFVPLEERTEIANKHKADLFLSIHANYSRNSRVSGVETYILNFARTADERELASRENAASHRTISDLEDLVRSITRQEKLNESKELARSIQKRLQHAMTKLNPSSRNRGIRQAPFVVLAGASMPSVLTEVAFLSNPRDAAALLKDKPRSAAAEALFQGVFDYIRSLSSEASISQRHAK